MSKDPPESMGASVQGVCSKRGEKKAAVLRVLHEIQSTVGHFEKSESQSQLCYRKNPNELQAQPSEQPNETNK